MVVCKKTKPDTTVLRINWPDLLSSLQTLAIYDRFGRLMYGQEDVPKDVLEYVVFEKHLTNPYGSWRMHGKIVPPWAPPKQPILKVRQLVRFKRAEAIVVVSCQSC